MTEDLEGRTTADRYFLTCKVETRKLEYREHQSRKQEWNEQADIIVLLPFSSTEADCFYHAWLPEKLTEAEKAALPNESQHSEIVMETGYPLNGYFRGAIKWGDNVCDQPHIFVMTKRAEELLKQKIGSTISVTVLGDGEEDARYELRTETRSPIQGMQ